MRSPGQALSDGRTDSCSTGVQLVRAKSVVGAHAAHSGRFSVSKVNHLNPFISIITVARLKAEAHDRGHARVRTPCKYANFDIEKRTLCGRWTRAERKRDVVDAWAASGPGTSGASDANQGIFDAMNKGRRLRSAIRALRESPTTSWSRPSWRIAMVAARPGADGESGLNRRRRRWA